VTLTESGRFTQEVTHSIRHSSESFVYASAPSSLLCDKIILNLHTAVPSVAQYYSRQGTSSSKRAPHDTDFRFFYATLKFFKEGMAHRWLSATELEDEDVTLVRGQDF
jgi:hypothetical protein